MILIIIFKNNIKKRYAKINKIDIKLMDEKILLIDFIKNTKVFLTTKRLIRIDINGNTIFTANVNEDIENISRMTANRICIKLKNGRKEILPVGQMKNIWFDVLTNLKK